MESRCAEARSALDFGRRTYEDIGARRQDHVEYPVGS